MVTTPDYDAAATKAMQILIDNEITETPIIPLPILMKYPNVRVMSFTSIADNTEIDRSDLIPMFGANQDAVTFHLSSIEGVKYVVVYNMRLPFEVIWRGIARELGHIALGHDGATRTSSVRMQEAMCFAHHLLTPRPVIRMFQESGMPFTMNVLSSVTGCSDECVDDMKVIPGVHVDKELNLKVRELFSRGIGEYIRFHRAAQKIDKSQVVDFGTFMDNYEE